MADLSTKELGRYARHLTLPQVGLEGQRKLKAASVLVVGAGGLGSPAALYLAAAGVGRLGLVDADAVETSNLQRQVLYGESTLGARKVSAAAARLRDLNPHVRLELHDLRLTRDNALDVLASYDIVVDGSDNFPTRYLVSDACVLLGKPEVYASIFRFEGQMAVFDARRGPCYRCLFPTPPPPELVPSCVEGGVLGVLPGILGTLQASETLKLLLGVGEPALGRLLAFDALSLGVRALTVRKSRRCPACGEAPTLTELVDYEGFCGVRPPAETSASETRAAPLPALSPRELARRLGREPLTLLDVREPFEWEIARLPAAKLVPLGELPGRLREIDAQAPVVVYCHHGQRSLAAAGLLRAAGFGDVYNLEGGIDAWSREIDPAVARY